MGCRTDLNRLSLFCYWRYGTNDHHHTSQTANGVLPEMDEGSIVLDYASRQASPGETDRMLRQRKN
jgi:hypothetical protein